MVQARQAKRGHVAVIKASTPSPFPSLVDQMQSLAVETAAHTRPGSTTLATLACLKAETEARHLSRNFTRQIAFEAATYALGHCRLCGAFDNVEQSRINLLASIN